MARYDDIQIISFYGIKTTENKVKKCQRQLNRKMKRKNTNNHKICKNIA